MSADPRPVLFVTNYAPPYRAEPFRRLARAEDVEFVLVGGAVRHGGAAGASTARQRDVFATAASGRYRAVIAGISGRVALPAAFAGARRARVPFVLWATIWRHPRTAAHVLSYLPLRHIYRDADAIVTYGPHVSDYVRAKGARTPVFEAPQAVDNEFWGANSIPRTLDIEPNRYRVMFAGRLDGEKGLTVLADAWRASGFAQTPYAALVMAGDGRFRAPVVAAGAELLGPRTPEELRDLYAAADVVVLPSLRTRQFLEPWGLVVNEAFNQGTPVIVSDAVGAAQPPGRGLVRHECNGLVVPAGDARALAGALVRLRDDPDLRARLGAQARFDVRAYDFDAWVAGMRRGLAAVGVSRRAP